MRFRLLPLVAVLAAVACAPAGGTPARPADGGGPSSPLAGSPHGGTLRLVIRAEPPSLVGSNLMKPFGSTETQKRLFNAGLVLRDGDTDPTRQTRMRDGSRG